MQFVRSKCAAEDFGVHASKADLRRMAVLSYAKGFTHWYYRCPSGHEDIVSRRSYWVDVRDDMVPGDIITVSNPDMSVVLHVGRDFCISELMSKP